MKGRALMVQGTASSVGKSLLATALCRIYARRGLKVAPFKSQNMALNSGVTPEGGEIGRAQLAQAAAAGVAPHVDMNPILLKPESDSRSQVVVLGRAIGSMHFRDYHEKKPALRELVGAALDRLRARHDLVVIEGAGSPAEVNLKERDLVNMWVAGRAEAPVLLVADIERGGALAAVVGTLALLSDDERARVQGIVINKFRGDPALFADGVHFLEARTGVRVVGVVPHLGDARIAAEDSLDLPRPSAGGPRRVAIVKLPHLSNFDELAPLFRLPGLAARWVDTADALEGAALVILPGTKCTVADLGWLRQRGLDAALVARAAAGGAILGICGGYQLLGERIEDPEEVEARSPAERQVAGLGLLPVRTRFFATKETRPVTLELAEELPLLEGAGGAAVGGYEIHCGRVLRHGGRPLGRLIGGERSGDEGAVLGRVAGTLVHGLFENAVVQRALAGSAELADPYERVADHFAAALDLAHLDRLVGR